MPGVGARIASTKHNWLCGTKCSEQHRYLIISYSFSFLLDGLYTIMCSFRRGPRYLAGGLKDSCGVQDRGAVSCGIDGHGMETGRHLLSVVGFNKVSGVLFCFGRGGGGGKEVP